MMLVIKKGDPKVWMLVKAPRITDAWTGRDQTAHALRQTLHDSYFADRRTSVRRLTAREVEAIKWVSGED